MGDHPETRTDRRAPLAFGLALQGGGSHGAFAWGVLDRLLEEPDLTFPTVSGTSAGAVNAVLLGAGWRQGLAEGDPRGGARALLRAFWHTNAKVGMWLTMGLLGPTPIDQLRGDPTLKNNPLFLFFDTLGRFLSPYDQPGSNPLGWVLDFGPAIDFSGLASEDGPQVHLTATDVTTGEARVFGPDEMSRETLLASATRPTLARAQAVGEAFYWDGGYSANPAFAPLLANTDLADIIVVQVNPVDTQGPPQAARDILNRINEITFNSSMLWQLKGIERLNEIGRIIDVLVDAIPEQNRDAVAKRLRDVLQREDDVCERFSGTRPNRRLTPGLKRLLLEETTAKRGGTTVKERPLRQIAMHRIGGDDALDAFDASSKFNVTPAFLETLFTLGRSHAETWLETVLPGLVQARADGICISTFTGKPAFEKTTRRQSSRSR